MFIINDKYHCCNDNLTDVRFKLLPLASKEYLRRIQIIFMLLELVFH